MRDIKFRGLDLNNEWCYGYLLLLNGKSYILVPKDNTFDTIEVQSDTVGQAVTIHSSKKVELYEGDIIEIENATELERSFSGTVWFKDGTFVLKSLKQRNPNYTELIEFWNDGNHEHHSLEILCDGYCDIKVVGNIHTN